MHTTSLQTALQPTTGVTPQGPVQGRAASSSGTTAAGSAAASTAPNSAAITSNDFLTLLVTELKNQDPTQQTDPNQYINQLVQINSLQQLIEINQNLKPAAGSSSPAAPRSSASQTGIASRAQPGSPPQVVSGNLGTPHDSSPATAVAHALTHAGATAPVPAAAETQTLADPIAAALAQARAVRK